MEDNTEPKPDLAVKEDEEGVYLNVMERHYECATCAPDNLPQGFLQTILAEFKRHGYDVSDVAVKHNYDAWRRDLKSGFRDEARKVFLFTPCGCNRLYFHASRLSYRDQGWQTTYVC